MSSFASSDRPGKTPAQRRRTRRIAAVAVFTGLCVGGVLMSRRHPSDAIGTARRTGPIEGSSPAATRAEVGPIQAPVGAAVPNAPGAPAANAEDVENARIQRYLDSLYKRSDVRSSFRTKFGEDIDCIDFSAQPSVRARAARGVIVPIPDLSKLPPNAIEANPGADIALEDVSFNGKPDEDGHPRKCFGNTVPVVRTSPAQIKYSGGLDAYLRRRRAMSVAPPPQSANEPVDAPGFMHVVAQYWDVAFGEYLTGLPLPLPFYGGSSTASVWMPAADGTASLIGGHSLGQTWTSSPANGTACTGSGSASNCAQTIEVGWIVSPADTTGDGAFAICNASGVCAPDPNPHLFTFSTQDGYWSTGCYDWQPCMPAACGVGSGFILEPCNEYTNDLVPNPIELPTGALFTPGMTLSSSKVGATSVEYTFSTTLGTEELWRASVTIPGTNIGGPIGLWSPDTWNGAFYQCSGGNSTGAGGTCCPPGGEPTGTACLPNGTFPEGLTTTAGAPLTTGAALFQAGGEVGNPGGTPFGLGEPAAFEMGSGIGAPEGFKFAAYHRDVEFYVPVFEDGELLGTTAYNAPGSQSFMPFTPPFDTTNSAGNPIFATDMNCYNYGFGIGGVPKTVSLTTASLGYTLLQYPGETPTSVVSAAPGVAGNGASGWGNYLYYGGAGTESNAGFQLLDPKPNEGYDFCCTIKAQNGVGPDLQCAASQPSD